MPSEEATPTIPHKIIIPYSIKLKRRVVADEEQVELLEAEVQELHRIVRNYD